MSRTKRRAAPVEQPAAPSGEPIGYANMEMIARIRDTPERSMVVYPRPTGTYTTPVFAAPGGEAVAWLIASKFHCTGITKDRDVAEHYLTTGEAVPLYAHPQPAEGAQEDSFTLDDLANACLQAEIPDSTYESLCIALKDQP